MLKTFMLLVVAGIAGCAPVTATIQFNNHASAENHNVSGTVTVRLSKVQEFRSMLEAVMYRESEKPAK